MDWFKEKTIRQPVFFYQIWGFLENFHQTHSGYIPWGNSTWLWKITV